MLINAAAAGGQASIEIEHIVTTTDSLFSASGRRRTGDPETREALIAIARR